MKLLTVNIKSLLLHYSHRKNDWKLTALEIGKNKMLLTFKLRWIIILRHKVVFALWFNFALISVLFRLKWFLNWFLTSTISVDHKTFFLYSFRIEILSHQHCISNKRLQILMYLSFFNLDSQIQKNPSSKLFFIFVFSCLLLMLSRNGLRGERITIVFSCQVCVRLFASK